MDHKIEVINMPQKQGGGGFCARCGSSTGAWFMCHDCIEELLYLERDAQQLRREEIAQIARDQRYLRSNGR